MHVHVTCPDGEAKFWIEPIVCLADHYQLTRKQLQELQCIVESHIDEIITFWKAHFRS